MVLKVTPPSAITRHEQMIVWAIMAGNESFPTQSILERPNTVSFNVETQIIKTPTGLDVFIGRVVMPLDDYSVLPAGSKPWLATQDIATGVPVPAYYSAN